MIKVAIDGVLYGVNGEVKVLDTLKDMESRLRRNPCGEFLDIHNNKYLMPKGLRIGNVCLGYKAGKVLVYKEGDVLNTLRKLNEENYPYYFLRTLKKVLRYNGVFPNIDHTKLQVKEGGNVIYLGEVLCNLKGKRVALNDDRVRLFPKEFITITKCLKKILVDYISVLVNLSVLENEVKNV